MIDKRLLEKAAFFMGSFLEHLIKNRVVLSS